MKKKNKDISLNIACVCMALYLLAALQYPLVHLAHMTAHFLSTHSPSHAAYLSEEPAHRHWHAPGTPAHHHSAVLQAALQNSHPDVPAAGEALTAGNHLQELPVHYCPGGAIFPESHRHRLVARTHPEDPCSGIFAEPLIPPPRDGSIYPIAMIAECQNNGPKREVQNERFLSRTAQPLAVFAAAKPFWQCIFQSI